MGAPKKFRLAAVLKVREMQERVAAGHAAAATHAARQAQTVAEERARDAATFAPPTVCEGAVFIAASHHGLRLVTDAENAAAAATVSAEQAAEANRAWTEAARATKVMEKLRDRHVEAVNSALEHAEIKAVDDIVTRAYAVRTRQPSPTASSPASSPAPSPAPSSAPLEGHS